MILEYSLVENQLTERPDDYSAQTHSKGSVGNGTLKKYATFQTGRTNMSGLHGRLRPDSMGAGVHTVWAYASMQHGRMRPCSMGAGRYANTDGIDFPHLIPKINSK